jgi:hypothetical protein
MTIDEALDDQRELVELAKEAGWDVTDVELAVYDSPWEDEDAPEATVTLTVKRAYGDREGDEEGGDDDSPYRVK